MVGARELTLVPGRSAFLVVGVENDFIHPNGKLHAGPSTLGCVPKIARMLTRAREEKVKIFFLHSVRAADAPEFKYFGHSPFLQEGTWNSEITDELKPQRGEVVVEMRSFDCFARTELESLLGRYDVRPCEDKLVIMGGNVHASLYQAVTGFSVRHYYVVVPVDCTYGEEDARKRALNRLSDVGYNHNVALTNSSRIKLNSQ